MIQSNDNPFTRIAATVDLADLALVLVAGPDHRAIEGLLRIRSHLPTDRETFWHRLDRDGPDIASTLHRAATAHPIVLVHGLERLPEAPLLETEARLNLLRDTLATTRGAIILWIPSSAFASFRSNCADLYHWRSLLVELTERDVPVDPELEARREYISLVRQRFELRGDEFFVEPEVLPMDTPQPQPLRAWLRRVQQGLLIGGPGAGKSFALKAYAADLARAAEEEPLEAPLPLVVNASRIRLMLMEGKRLPSLNELMRHGHGFPDRWEHAGTLEQWAIDGRLVLLVDGVHDTRPAIVSGSTVDTFQWLERFKSQYPGVRIIATGRSYAARPGPHWEQASLLPFNGPRIHAFLERYFLATDPSQVPAAISHSNVSLAEYYSEMLEPLSSIPRLLDALCTHVRVSRRLLLTLMWKRLIQADLNQSGWSGLTNRGTFLTLPQLKQALQLLALELLQRHQADFDLAGMEGLIRSLEGGRNKPDGRTLLYAGTDHVCILEQVEPDRYRFAHPRIQAFLAAQQLVQDKRGALEALERHVDDESWHELFLFALEMLWHTYGVDKGSFLDALWPLGEGMRIPMEPDVRLKRAALILEAVARDVAVEAQIPEELLEKWQDRDLQALDSLNAFTHPAAYNALLAASRRLGGFRLSPP